MLPETGRREGIFPLGSIKDNMIVSKIADSALFKPISMGNVDQAVTHWNQRLKTNARLPMTLSRC